MLNSVEDQYSDNSAHQDEEHVYQHSHTNGEAKTNGIIMNGNKDHSSNGVHEKVHSEVRSKSAKSSIVSSHSTKTTSKSRTKSKSKSTGRSSDVKYEMEYEKMAQIMKDAVRAKPPPNLNWQPLQLWIRWNEENDVQGQWAPAPMKKRIAGSCHELVVAYLKSSKGEILTRLIKLARDPDEDNKHHFETERKVSQYLTRIATYINRCYHSRTDVCIWPVETIYFEHEGRMRWATVQAPFLPEDNSVFVKIEPNSGKPCVHDPVVGRYQHAFAAFTCGLDLVRDWQGYGVPQSVFLKQCEITQTPEAIEQIRIRSKPQTTQVLIVIDPVLTTCTAHYETNNPTDFGIKAIDEWLQTHDCDRCRCDYFYLAKNIRFCLSDPGQKFFQDNTPLYLIQNVKKLRNELNIWNGDDWIPPIYDEDNNNNNHNHNNNNNNNNNVEIKKDFGKIDLKNV